MEEANTAAQFRICEISNVFSSLVAELSFISLSFDQVFTDIQIGGGWRCVGDI